MVLWYCTERVIFFRLNESMTSEMGRICEIFLCTGQKIDFNEKHRFRWFLGGKKRDGGKGMASMARLNLL